MQVSGAVALVTGANRGLGAEIAQALLDRGAAKVYAAARDASAITDPRLTPLQLDVTGKNSIAAAVQQARDVNILVNNAGVGTLAGVLGEEDDLRRVMEVNYFGLVAVTRAFAPVLGANGGGAVANVLSVASWRAGGLGAYSVSKSAAWAATNSMRISLAAQGTLVVGVHCGFLDTDLTAGIDVPKLPPRLVADQTVDGIENDAYEVVADDLSREVKAALSGSVQDMYAGYLPARIGSE